MNILVINGSPKGKYSVTLQSCLFLEKKFPAHSFTYLDAGQRIRSLEKDFTPALEAIRSAQLLIFSYPVYTFLVPSQLHRFIELMKESGEDFSGKAATQLSTSKHFYDVTAHRFMNDNFADMGLAAVDGLSADMDDILTERGRLQATSWLDFVLWRISRGDFMAVVGGSPFGAGEGVDAVSRLADARPHRCASLAVPPLTMPRVAWAPAESASPDDATVSARRAVIVTDLLPGDDALKAMIDRFVGAFPYATDIINIREFPFQGGCMGCFNCAATGKCIYKDGFDSFLRDTIHRHDAIIYAFRIKDHSMGSRFKMYDDRQFCNGHRTVTMGTPFGYLVAGRISVEENLRFLLEARAQVGGNFLAGIASDDPALAPDLSVATATTAASAVSDSPAAPDAPVAVAAADADAAPAVLDAPAAPDPLTSVDRLAQTLVYALDHAYNPPQNFLGVGGMKIFRDLIYMMRGLMRADHKFFKSHGQYDFPQKKWPTSMMMYLVGGLMGNRKLRSKMGNKMNEGMLAPYKKMLEKVS